MGPFEIAEGLDRMQMDAVMGLLKTTHWAASRAVTDCATIYRLCDVIADPT